WAADRPYAGKTLDAHGLYFQTLAELGAVGLALLLVALVAPLVAAVRARRAALVPVAFGAYVTFLVHNAGDWDWQLTGVGAAGLLCGVALCVSGTPGPSRIRLTLPARIASAAIAIALAAFAFVGVMSSVPLRSAQAAASQGRWAASA